MSVRSLRLPALLLASTLGLSACAYDDGYGYGYGGAHAGYDGYCDPYWDDCYGGHGGYGYGDNWYGWYDDYYYPGWGIYIYDQWRRPYRWSDDHRRYWETRRHRFGDRNWNDRRWERWDGWDRGDRREWRRDRRWHERDGDRRRWRDRRRGDWQGNAGPATAGGEPAPRGSGEVMTRESRRDWSGTPTAAPRDPPRAAGRAWQGRQTERDPD